MVKVAILMLVLLFWDLLRLSYSCSAVATSFNEINRRIKADLRVTVAQANATEATTLTTLLHFKF